MKLPGTEREVKQHLMPYFVVTCWEQLSNLRQEFEGDDIEVRYRVYPAKDIITETWQVSEEGRNTFLIPPAESALVGFLVGSDAGELRMEVNYGSHRFPVAGFSSACGWLQDICQE